jgi:hypothetical protein
MTPVCEGSHRHVAVSPGQTSHTGGYVRPNQARDVRCPVCHRSFPTVRVSYTDHGIPTNAAGLIPRHNTPNER